MKNARRRRNALLLTAVLVAIPRFANAQVPAPADTLRLEAAVRAALATDPRLAAASARVGQAEAGRGVAAAGRLPSVAASALVNRFGQPMVVAPLHGFDPTRPPDFDATLIQGRVQVSQLLYDGGATRARIAAAESLETAAQAGVDDAVSVVLEELVENWLRVLTARDVLGAERERVLDLQAEGARARQLFDQGAAPRLASLRADAELSAAEASVDGARARLTLAESGLARRIATTPQGVAASALEDLSDVVAAVRLQSTPRAEPAGLAAARARVDAAAARVGEASATRRPRLSASGGLQELGGGSSDFRTEWQGGIQVDYSLFSGGARTRAIEVARAEQLEAAAELDEVERRLRDAEDAAQAARQEALARGAALERSVQALAELVRIERLALDEGAGVQRDFLQAAADLAEARAGLAQARRAAVLAAVQQARVTGRLTPEWIVTLTEVER